MKRTGLEKLKAAKLVSEMKQSGPPGQAGRESPVDRRERRRRDQALGLVPFAVKLDAELVKRIHALALSREGGVNELVAELLRKGLETS
ncbi:MAG: hypothetical protein HY017_05540 [Betaproteobacteria bacterium]|nr:hypothetical protein [Betaproteobacteria bacterium]